MASLTETLEPIYNRRRSPIRFVRKTIAGDDELDIKPSPYYDSDAVWELIGAKFLMTTDATVANRSLVASVRVGNGEYQVDVFAPKVQTASDVVTSYMLKIAEFDASNLQMENYLGLTKYGFLIGGEDFMRIQVTNGVAGDSVLCHLRFRWLNWELGIREPSVVENEERLLNQYYRDLANKR